MKFIAPTVFNPISKATRQIRSNWTLRERDFRRRLAQVRSRQILEMIQNSAASANLN